MGGIIPPIGAKKCVIMSRKKHSPRASRAYSPLQTSARPNRLGSPVWLVLFWLDLAIVDSGFLHRRRLLRLRNDLLQFLRVPSGPVWSVNNPKESSQK